MTEPWFERVRPLLDSAAPAVLMTHRWNGEAAISPVWFRWYEDAFEVVIAEGDTKLRHLERDPRCSLLIFEAALPFRGVRASGVAEVIRGDVTPVRVAISGRYLGGERQGERYAESRRSKPGVVVRLVPADVTAWDLADILPS
jgi:PPOX class probable F420-dependent enzyme